MTRAELRRKQITESSHRARRSLLDIINKLDREKFHEMIDSEKNKKYAELARYLEKLNEKYKAIDENIDVIDREKIDHKFKILVFIDTLHDLIINSTLLSPSDLS